MVGDLLPGVEFTSEARPKQVQSTALALDLSEDGEGSEGVTGVGGVEYPSGEPLLLGVLEGSELSLAPSNCL